MRDDERPLSEVMPALLRPGGLQELAEAALRRSRSTTPCSSPSRKAELLALGTRVSLCAQRESAPYAYVTVEGPVVRIEAGTDEDIRELATRYLGSDEDKTYADTITSGRA